MNELLKELGLTYYFSRSVTSVPDDVNIIKKTNYAYHMRCKVGLGRLIPRSPYQRPTDSYIDFLWYVDLGYLGVHK